MRPPVVNSLACLLILPAVGAGVGAGPEDPPPPIPSLAWGESPAEAGRRHPLQFETTVNRTERYLCAVDSVGGAAIGDCRLEFVEGRLAGIAVTTRGERDSGILLRALLRVHGEAEQGREGSLRWEDGGTRIAYDRDSAGDACIYWYRMNVPWQR